MLPSILLSLFPAPGSQILFSLHLIEIAEESVFTEEEVNLLRFRYTNGLLKHGHSLFIVAHSTIDVGQCVQIIGVPPDAQGPFNLTPCLIKSLCGHIGPCQIIIDIPVVR